MTERWMRGADLPRVFGLAGAGALSLPATIAFVGAGGKTSAMFSLAEAMAFRPGAPCRVIVTTTTHIRDPRSEGVRRRKIFGRVLFVPNFAQSQAQPPAQTGDDVAATIRQKAHTWPAALGDGQFPLVLASGRLAEENRLCGIHPGRAEELERRCDLLLVEADGSRGLPVKAPAWHEPVIPPNAALVVGVIGLDCLGKELGPNVAHRPEIFGPLVGCAPGQKIEPRHLNLLVRSPQGLFKGCPSSCRRVVLLNKADTVPAEAVAPLLELLGSGGGEAFPAVVSCLKGAEYGGQGKEEGRRCDGV